MFSVKTEWFSAPRRHYLAAFLVAIIVFSLHYFGFVRFFDAEAVDLCLLLRGEQKAHEDIVIIEIDDTSLKSIGPLPWPREIHAELIEKIEYFRPRLILYDIYFTDAGRGGGNPKLGLAMEKSANVFLPFLYLSIQPFDAFFPIPVLRESARGLGFTNLETDPDGHVRRVRYAINTGERVFFHLAVAAGLSQFREEEDARRWLKRIPLDKHQTFWINYPGSVDSFKRISFSRVLNAEGGEKKEIADILRDKIVLVGYTATGNVKLKPVVFSPVYPEIAIHASAINTLLSGNFLYETPALGRFLIVLVICLAVALFTLHFSPRWSVLIALGLLGGYMILNFIVFLTVGLLLPFFMPVVAGIATYLILLFWRDVDIHFREELMGRELEMAAGIQASFLATQPPVSQSLDIAFKYRFARHVGGDFYDWIDLGDGRMAIAVGDVSGKGVPAAIYMVRAISEFRRENSAERTPSEVLQKVNELLAVRSYAGMFLTITYAIINEEKMELEISSAGHDPLVYYRAATGKAESIHIKKGPPVGLFTDSGYETVRMKFEKGDVLLLLSDGVTEQRNAQGEMFGSGRVEKVLEHNAYSSNTEGVIDQLFWAIDEFRGETEPHDDQTLLAVKFGQRF